MVDIVSAEARRKELLDESLGCVYPDDVAGIKQRYKDTSLVLFKEQLSHQHADNRSFLSFGTRRSSTVSEYGNTPIIVRKSRSANGELSKVGEQWPSLRGRSSLSNYTLHEGQEQGNGEDEEQEEEETETEDEGDVKTKKSKEEVKAGAEGNRELVIIDGQPVCGGKANVDHGAKEGDVGVHESAEGGVTGNRKSFSHYDLQLQRPKGFIDEDPRDDDIEDAIDDDKDAVSMRTVLEVEGVDHKILLLRPDASKKEPSDVDVSHNQVDSASKKDQEIVSETSCKEEHHEKNSDKVVRESHDESAVTVSGPSNADHSIVPLENVQNSSSVNNVLSDRETTNLDSKCSNQQSSSDWSNVELRIIEPSDLSVPDSSLNAESFNVASEGDNSLTSKLLSSSSVDDNDDVIFIDEYSPLLGQKKNSLPKVTNSGKDASQVPDSASPVPAKQQAKQLSESLSRRSPAAENSLPKVTNSGKDASQIPDSTSPVPAKQQADQLSESSSRRSPAAENCSGTDSMDELDKSIEAENQNGLLALPVRSPTPPKKSPRRSPRVPKSKEKNHERHSSLDLPRKREQQPSTSLDLPTKREQQPSTSKTAASAKMVASASPTTSKGKDPSRIFNFSLKKERSKSVSSLSSKKNRDKEKVVRSESEDPGAVNSSVVLAGSDDAKCETPGKRVGVRSMVIDGTIKRNFIVIHPSDDSETIGLAPLSSFANGSRSSVRASKALSSVRSHITGVSSTKIESVKRISSKQELKEELMNTSKDARDRESLNTDVSTGKLKSKKSITKRQTESHVHGSSVSLTSTVSHINSKVVMGGPPGGLSEVDCDLVSVSNQGIPSSSTKTTSRLCVIM